MPNLGPLLKYTNACVRHLSLFQVHWIAWRQSGTVVKFRNWQPMRIHVEIASKLAKMTSFCPSNGASLKLSSTDYFGWKLYFYAVSVTIYTRHYDINWTPYRQVTNCTFSTFWARQELSEWPHCGMVPLKGSALKHFTILALDYCQNCADVKFNALLFQFD